MRWSSRERHWSASRVAAELVRAGPVAPRRRASGEGLPLSRRRRASRESRSVGVLGCAYALVGRQKDARALLDELLARKAERFVPQKPFILLYTALGDIDRALDALEDVYEQRGTGPLGIAAVPLFARLRGQPRFEALLARLAAHQRNVRRPAAAASSRPPVTVAPLSESGPRRSRKDGGPDAISNHVLSWLSTWTLRTNVTGRVGIRREPSEALRSVRSLYRGITGSRTNDRRVASWRIRCRATHVLRVPLVVPAGIEVAVVLRKPGGRDGDAQPMARGDHARREPQIDVVLVGLCLVRGATACRSRRGSELA